MAPQPGQTICDPACGTGGFLLAAHDYLSKHHQLDRAQKKQLTQSVLQKDAKVAKVRHPIRSTGDNGGNGAQRGWRSSDLLSVSFVLFCEMIPVWPLP